MLYRGTTDNQPQDRKLCHYKCDCGHTEFKIRLEKSDRNMRRWCKHCKKFIYPIAVTQTTTTYRQPRASVPARRR